MMLSVRPIEDRDIESFLSYWYDASDEFLHGMGADPKKIPAREDFLQLLDRVMNSADEEKPGFILIWEDDGIAVGHSNINQLKFGESARMHLHMWRSDNRKKGQGAEFVKRCIPIYFEKFNLQTLICEPFAGNPAPNKLLSKVGFEFEKSYFGSPGMLNFDQDVNVFRMNRKKYEELYR